MAAEKRFTLSIVIRAVDRATVNVRKINDRISDTTKPIRKLTNSIKLLSQEAGLLRLAKAFGRVGHSVRGMGEAAHRAFGRFERIGGLLAIVGGVAGGGIYEAFSRIADRTKQVMIASNALGVSTAEMQKWHHVASMAGVDLEQFNRGMFIFGARVGQLRMGTGGLLQILRKMPGGEAEKIFDRLKVPQSTTQSLEILLDAMEKIKDPGIRLAVARAAFGRQAQLILELAEEGMPLIRKWMADAEKLGIIMSEAGIKAGNRFYVAMKTFKAALSGIGIIAAESLFDKFAAFAEDFTEFVKNNQPAIRRFFKDFEKHVPTWDQFVDKLKGARKQLSPVIGMFRWLSRHVGGDVNAALVLVGAYIAGPMVAAVASLTAATLALIPALVAVGTTSLLAFAPFFLVAAAILGVIAAAKLSDRIYNGKRITATEEKDLAVVERKYEPRDSFQLVKDYGFSGAAEYARTGKVPAPVSPFANNPHFGIGTPGEWGTSGAARDENLAALTGKAVVDALAGKPPTKAAMRVSLYGLPAGMGADIDSDDFSSLDADDGEAMGY